MHRWFTFACLLVASTQPALSQQRAMTIGEYIDSQRPQIEKRALTPEEAETARDLLKLLKKNGMLTEAQLKALRPIANTGDLPAMKGMFTGYGKHGSIETEILGSNFKPETEAMTGLYGLWAVALWKEGERSKELAGAIDYCLAGSGEKFGFVKSHICGFDATIEGDYEHNLYRYASPYKEHKGSKPPFSIVFNERLLVPKATPEEERARFQRILAKWNAGQPAESSECWRAVRIDPLKRQVRTEI